MYGEKRLNDSVHWYMDELSARVVAESGRACDRYHLGKLILRGLKDAPEFTLQIDAATGQSETNASVLERSVKCAVAMKKSGIQKGDVIALLAPNHLDVGIVYYAALYLGAIFTAVDRNATNDELPKILDCDQPKLIFCHDSKINDIQNAISKVNCKAEIVTFDERKDLCNFADFLKYGDDSSLVDFKPTDFDPETTIASLMSTSGTTGIPKKTILTHKNFLITGPHLWSRCWTFPSPTRMILITAPLQWISSTINFNMSPILRYTRLQTSDVPTTQNVYRMINTYKPTFIATSTTMMSNLIKPGDRDQCDLSCFECIYFGGSPVSKDLVKEVRDLIPKAEVFGTYGFTEAGSYLVFQIGTSPIYSCGKPITNFQYRLINVDTQEYITESNKSGELWVKSPGVTMGYYNNPEATKAALTDDGWFKTGDIFYRDDQWNFYFVDRIKSLIRYRDYLISPAELEVTIRSHPGVFDVAVSGIPDYSCISLPVACVVKRPGCELTAQEIKDLVKVKLEDWKQLRGGVIFLKELPLTPTTKIDRRKLKEIVLQQVRE